MVLLKPVLLEKAVLCKVCKVWSLVRGVSDLEANDFFQLLTLSLIAAEECQATFNSTVFRAETIVHEECKRELAEIKRYAKPTNMNS